MENLKTRYSYSFYDGDGVYCTHRDFQGGHLDAPPPPRDRKHNIETSSTNIQRSPNTSTNQWEQMEDVDPPLSSWDATTIFVDNQGAMNLAENPLVS